VNRDQPPVENVIIDDVGENEKENDSQSRLVAVLGDVGLEIVEHQVFRHMREEFGM
jgi:hypothetical protein